MVDFSVFFQEKKYIYITRDYFVYNACSYEQIDRESWALSAKQKPPKDRITMKNIPTEKCNHSTAELGADLADLCKKKK